MITLNGGLPVTSASLPAALSFEKRSLPRTSRISTHDSPWKRNLTTLPSVAGGEAAATATFGGSAFFCSAFFDSAFGGSNFFGSGFAASCFGGATGSGAGTGVVTAATGIAAGAGVGVAGAWSTATGSAFLWAD